MWRIGADAYHRLARDGCEFDSGRQRAMKVECGYQVNLRELSKGSLLVRALDRLRKDLTEVALWDMLSRYIREVTVLKAFSVVIRNKILFRLLGMMKLSVTLLVGTLLIGFFPRAPIIPQLE